MNNPSSEATSRNSGVRVIRFLILVLFVASTIGTGLDLVLLGHTKDFWRLAPLFLIIICLTVLLWRAYSRNPATLRVFQAVMLLFVASGAAGLWLHYDGNVQFELEMYPSMTGWELFREAVSGASPALAPGVMMQLGLLGLVYTYRHPAFLREPDPIQYPDTSRTE